MEYKIFHTLRKKIRIPWIARFMLGIILIILGVSLSIIPIIPGFVLVIAGVLLMIPGKYIKDVIKIRKNLAHLFQNLHNKHIIKHKFYDLLSHLKKIIRRK